MRHTISLNCKKTVFITVVLCASIFTKTKAQLITSTATKINIANAVIYVDSTDDILIQKSAIWLQKDIEKVTGNKPTIVHQVAKQVKNLVVIGSLKQSSLVKMLEQKKCLHLQPIASKWEAFQIQTITIDNVQSLVIVGSDRRGTAYGVLELSKQIGVSPWYWWADVPTKKQANIYINTTAMLTDAPKVKYRGFFINDEAPALSGWSKEKFGGFNHQFYEHVFELLLRLKANYLWPAMWGNAFNTDDTLNPIKADEYGIVMGTSHHEPMLRAQQEWKKFGKGAWDYTKNDTVLRSFWKKGIENMGSHESLVTVGMRGDGDMPMTQGTATDLLEKIVADQRKILEEVTQKPASATPQLWALYKEVQDYYDKGMRVPDDVTLLLCDDNWGNLRKLPKLTDKPRKGGYGIYYHFDYVGGPRNYKWINTVNIARVWEQMHLAYEHNVKDIWIVNVGDIKPMEFPISFFLDYAWNPEKIGATDLKKYTEQWSADQFGKQNAKEIADVIAKYSKFISLRKPEMLDANTYSFNYNEWARVVNANNSLLAKAQAINNALPNDYKDAFFQLVLHPVKAYTNLNDMYYNIALNKAAYKNKWATTNTYADKVKALYTNDSLITREYHQLQNGKWNHMMDQKHIGYTSWQEPRFQRMPEVKYVAKDSAVAESPAVTAKSEIANYPKTANYPLFFEQDKYISIGADHFTKAINTNGVQWKILPDLGRTGSSVTPFSVTAIAQVPAGNAPHLQYEFYTYSNNPFTVSTYCSPSLNFHNSEKGLQYAISIDDDAPQIISINSEDKNSSSGVWNRWVGDNIIIKNTKHNITNSGKHVLKFWMVNTGVVLQKLVLDFGGLKPSYLGPEETIKWSDYTIK
jgi:hypothetical protein